MKFKDRLIELRKEAGLSQDKFSKEIGFSRSAVSAWEIGRNEPSNSEIIKIAEYFGVSTDYLLGHSNIKNPVNSSSNTVILDVEGLDEDDIQEMQRQINYLKKKKNK